jgi:hypothetical protein
MLFFKQLLIAFVFFFLDWWNRFTARFEPVTKTERTDNCSVNLCYFGDKLYALTESPFIRQIDSETLDIIGEKVYSMICEIICTLHLLT